MCAKKSAGRISAAAVISISLLASPSSWADTRFQMLAFANDRQVKGSKVCFFKGRGPDDFLGRFFMSDDVRCYSGDEIIRLPTGYWNYFVEAPGLVSAHPLGISSGTVLEERLKPMRVELLPAATLDLQNASSMLRQGEHFAVYFTNEGQPSSRPSAKAIPRSARSVVVPAGMRVVPLIVRDESIVWAGLPLTLNAGETISLAMPERPGRNVGAIVMLETTVSPADRMAADGAKAPQVTLVDARETRQSVLPLRPSPVFDGSFVLFEEVTPGSYSIELKGDLWQADKIPVRVAPTQDSLPMPSRPLVTRPLGRLDVTWSLPEALARDASFSDCGATEKTATTTLIAKRCVFGFDRSAPRDCVAERTTTLPATLSGVAPLEKLAAGDYYVELSHGGVRARVRVPVRPAQTTRATVALEPAPITGRITRHSQSVRAEVRFSTGSAISDPDTGEYFAFVNGPPRLGEPVVVTPCDTLKTFFDVPTKPIKVDSRYDIDIPANSLRITVIDADSARPIRGAHVISRLMTAQNTVAARDLGMTDDSGTISDDGLSPAASFELCATIPDYETNCSRNMQAPAATPQVTIGLKRSTARSVKITSPTDLGFGKVFVVLNSMIIATANIEHHDSVRIEASTPPTASLFLAAKNYPLIRLALPNLADEQPSIELPPAKGAPLTVTLAADSKHHGGPFTLAMAGVPLPREILQYYQLIHNGDVLQIRNGETVSVGPIDTSLPLSILLWYWSKDAPVDTHGADPFETPALLQKMYVQPFEGNTVVISPN